VSAIPVGSDDLCPMTAFLREGRIKKDEIVTLVLHQVGKLLGDGVGA